MDYKQLSPDLVIRSACGCPVKMNDPNYLKWLGAGNSPFPPDPPIGDALTAVVSQKDIEEKVDITDAMVLEMGGAMAEELEP
jgi:hypothetical protein